MTDEQILKQAIDKLDKKTKEELAKMILELERELEKGIWKT